MVSTLSFGNNSLGGDDKAVGDTSLFDRKRKPAVYDPAFPAENLDQWLTVSYAFESEKLLTMELAMECDQLVKSDTYLKLYFSAEHSKEEKFRMAQEGIADKVAEASRAIASNMGKMIDHLLTHIRHQGSADITAAAVQKKKEALNGIESETLSGEAVQAANQALHETGKGEAMGSHAPIAQERFTANPSAHLHAPLTPYQADILGSGEYTKLIEAMLDTIDQVQPVRILNNARQAYRQVVNQHAGGDETAGKAHFMELIAGPKRAHRELMEAVNKIGEKHRSLESGHVEGPKDINHALRHFTAAATSHQIATYVREREELVPILERFREEANAQKTAPVNSEESRELFREMHGLLAVILKTDVLFQRFWADVNASCGYLRSVLEYAEWKLKQQLSEKGQLGRQIEEDAQMQQLKRISAALLGFSKKIG